MPTQFPEKVLFIDDDRFLLEAIRRQFRREFVVALASGADEALELFNKQGPIAVVVSDESMPCTSGCELLREIRKLKPETVCILFSGNMHAEALISAEDRAGLFQVLSKPSSREVILSSVVAAITEHRSNCSKTSVSGSPSPTFSSSTEGEANYAFHC